MNALLPKLLIIISVIVSPVVSGQNIKINEICSVNYESYEDDEDEHGDWVEFYNAGGASYNMAGMYLTDDFSNLTKYRIPSGNASETTIGSNNHRVYWFDDESYKGPLHAGFKLSNSGERLALVASDGVTIIDSVTFPALTYDVTYGRTNDGSPSWSFFPVATPDDDNSGGGFAGIAGKASFDMDAGFYPTGIQVALSTPDPQSTIYYSLNGNEPSPSRGILYTGPVALNSSKVMRARVFKPNHVPGEITTRSYFINRTHDLPVLSVATDSSNLWDEENGIYCFGVDDYDHYYPYYGANFWHSWKKPAHIELFESSGAEAVSQNLKISITGNTSRVYAQKSLNFESEDALGKNSISYQLYPQWQIADFKSFKMRNGGSDWSSTGIRDAFNHTLLEGATNVDHQSNRPVVLYLNGDYWGILNLTEKIDEHYIHEHYPSVDKDSIDLLYSNAEVKKGDANSYNDMISFIDDNSLAQQSNYNYIKTQIDIPDFIDYFQTRIYYATTDWPHKNIYYWRPKNQSMKWRWIMWDTDRSDLLSRDPSRQCNVDDNTLAWATTNSSDPWARFLLNNLLLNQEFKAQFITRYAHHMNFTFCPNRTDSVLNVFRSRLHNELPGHIARWEDSNDTLDYYTAGYYHSRAEWNIEVDTIEYFFDNRAQYMRQFILSQFNISGTSTLSLFKSPPQGGTIQIDGTNVPPNPCDLIYFDGYPITLNAVPGPGYVFSGWTATGGSTLPLTWVPDGDTTITAYFTPVIAAEPALPATNYSASISNCTDITINWNSGNGTSRMVIAKADGPVDAFPVDQQSYTANPVFGNGTDLGNGNFVVYTGNSNSCTVSGLTAGQTCHFAIIELNGDTITSNYNTTSYLTGSTYVGPVSISAGASTGTVCLGGSSTLTASGGVAWLWTPAAGLSSTTDEQVIATPASSTSYTVLATDLNGCQSEATVFISVQPLPVVALNGFGDICERATTLTLSGGTPAGGTYSGTGVAGGMFDPSLAGAGSHIITYTFTDTAGCTAVDTSAILVLAAPLVTLSAFSAVCQNSPEFALSGGLPPGGVYSGTSVSAGNFDPTIAGVGNHTITYSITDSLGCMNEATSILPVNVSPILFLGNDTVLCASGNLLLDAGNGSVGYRWSTGATTQSILIDSTGLGLGSFIFIAEGYTADGCRTIDSILVTFDICSGVPIHSGKGSFLVFPNPFQREITIFTDEPDFDLTIFDLFGKCVLSRRMTTSSPVLTPDISPGVYFLRANTPNGSVTTKLIKMN